MSFQRDSIVVLAVLIVLFILVMLLAWTDSPANELAQLREDMARQTALLESFALAQTHAVLTPAIASAPVIGGETNSFLAFAKQCNTDKVTAHEYQHAYQHWLGPLSRAGVLPFAIIEIGFAGGASACVWQKMLPNAERHSIEIACADSMKHKLDSSWMQKNAIAVAMLREDRLHCGNGANPEFMRKVLSKLKHPLTVFIDDGGHSGDEMVASFQYAFPRLAATTGIFFMEDLAESYRVGTQGFIPRIGRPLMEDLHYKADDPAVSGLRTVAQLSDYLRSVHCYQHICVYQRNDRPPLPP